MCASATQALVDLSMNTNKIYYSSSASKTNENNLNYKNIKSNTKNLIRKFIFSLMTIKDAHK